MPPYSNKDSDYEPFQPPPAKSRNNSRRNSTCSTTSSTSNQSGSSSSVRGNKLKGRRTRKYTSCEQCIDKKIKCDKAVFCASCAMRNLDCQWKRGTPKKPISERDELEAAKILIRKLESKVSSLESQLVMNQDQLLDHKHDLIEEDEQNLDELNSSSDEIEEIDVKPRILFSPLPVSYVPHSSPDHHRIQYSFETYSPHSPSPCSNAITTRAGIRPHFVHHPHSFIDGYYSPPLTPGDFENSIKSQRFDSSSAAGIIFPTLSNSNSNSKIDPANDNNLLVALPNGPHLNESTPTQPYHVYDDISTPYYFNSLAPYPTPPTPQDQFNISTSEHSPFKNGNDYNPSFFPSTSSLTSTSTSYNINPLQFKPSYQIQPPHEIESILQFPSTQFSTSSRHENLSYVNSRVGIHLSEISGEGQEKGRAVGGIVSARRSIFKPNYDFAGSPTHIETVAKE